MFLGVLIAYAIRSFISARLEQPKTNLTDRKHKMSLFFYVPNYTGTNSPGELYIGLRKQSLGIGNCPLRSSAISSPSILRCHTPTVTSRADGEGANRQ